MRSLSVDDMRRILSRGELFLLVDVRALEVTKGKSIPHSIRLPYGHGIVEKTATAAGQRALPVVVCGAGESCEVADHAAVQLEKAGVEEVWTYCSNPEAWVWQTIRSVPELEQVLSDPDLK